MIARERRRFRHWLDSPIAKRIPRRPDLCQPFIAVPKWQRQPDGTYKNVGQWMMPEEIEVLFAGHFVAHDQMGKRQRYIHGIFGSKAHRYKWNLQALIADHPAAWRSAPYEVREWLMRQSGFIALEDL